MSCEGGLTLFLELAEVRQQRCPLIRRDEPAIDNQAVRRKKRRQVGRWNQLRQVREEGVVVIEHLLERRRRVVVKIGGGLADAAQLRDVHPFDVPRLTRQEQSSRIRSRDELEGAIRQRDAVNAGVAREPRRTGREATRVRARAGGLYVVIAHEGTHERRLGRRAARMQCTAMALRAGAVEDYLALLLKLIQLRVCIGKWRRAGEDRSDQQFDPGRRKQRLLKSREVIKHPRRR